MSTNEYTSTIKDKAINIEKPKCICVPSGRCHSHLLLGCPHEHYFNGNLWTCILDKCNYNPQIVYGNHSYTRF